MTLTVGTAYNSIQSLERQDE